MAFDRIIKSASHAARLMVLVPLILGTVALTAPTPAHAAGIGGQTCTVVLFIEICTGGDGGTGGGSASPAPAPMLGGSLPSLAVLGGFMARRRRMAAKARGAEFDQPAIED